MKKLAFLVTSFFLSTVAGFAAAQTTQTGTYTTNPIEDMFAHEIGTAKKMFDLIAEFLVKYSFQVLGGILVIFLGWLVAEHVARFLDKHLIKKGVDAFVIKFIISIVKGIIIVFASLIALGKFGITIAPFIAALSVIGFGASFAIQGPLLNYAAGATLIFTKPFKVGNIVEVAGVTGEVTDMTLACTEMKTLDGISRWTNEGHSVDSEL
ncbi:MAG: mechanosensitive ion channel [Candidatus Tantalella remota]|nr:mechanosensitive ion channel [Candidatus Tantalella remota]